jgi:hypothetical protein
MEQECIKSTNQHLFVNAFCHISISVDGHAEIGTNHGDYNYALIISLVM